jgi:RNA polymerase sigma factor (sigma-70 family)
MIQPMTDPDVPTVAEVFADYGERMQARARRVLGSEADAEDAVQEVMLTLLDAPHVLSAVDRLGGWLLTMVGRRAVDLIRSSSRRRQREAAGTVDELFADAPDPAALMDRDEVAAAVAELVNELPDAQREVFVASALQGHTFKQISEQTGVPMGTLMARKKKAVDRIRARLRSLELIP